MKVGRLLACITTPKKPSPTFLAGRFATRQRRVVTREFTLFIDDRIDPPYEWIEKRIPLAEFSE